MKTPSLALVSLLLLSATSSLRADNLPAPWKHQNVGSAHVPGAASMLDGAFMVAGSMDLWGTTDGCHLTWQPLHGDGELVARVVEIDNPGGVAHAKASLCLRESLDGGARNVTLCVTPTDGTQFLTRAATDGKTARVADSETSTIPKGKFPCWLKLVRHGNDISAFESLDGKDWKPKGKTTLALPADVVVGLAASSHKEDILTTVKFDNVKLTTSAKAP